MRRVRSAVLAVFLLLAGAAVLCYPLVSQWYNQRYQINAVQRYDESVAVLRSEQMSAERERAKAYNAALRGAEIEDPFIPGSGATLPEHYSTILSIREGIMGYIEIPVIDVNLPIYHGTSEAVLEKGAGHMEMTALPVGGAGNHSVLTGHTGLPGKRLFTDLTELKMGDLFLLHVLDEVLAYEVDQILVTDPGDTEALRPAAGEDYVTLVTCTPYAVNSHRLLVRGRRTGYDAGEEEPPMPAKEKKLAYPLITAIIILALVGAGLGCLFYPRIAAYRYQLAARKTNRAYLERMQSYPPADLERLYQMIVAYNQNLYETGQEQLVDAFSYQQVDFSLIPFGFEEEMIGYIKIPAMKIELPIYLGASELNLRKGCAHLTQTSLPVGGKNTNAVLAAHRGMGTAAMFRQIERLKRGDKVYITNFRETPTYQVTDIVVIRPTDLERILIQEGRDMITLITCHPYRYNYQRYLVYCERVL